MYTDNDSDDRPRRRPRDPRRTWDRNPAQRPHSTKKGEKGYDRHREKDDLRRHLEEIDLDETEEE